MLTNPSHRALLIVDAQYDFINGTLSVQGAEEKMNRLTEYISQHANDYHLLMFTADWHPIDHCSYKQNGGIWPIHCLQHTHGAAIYQPIIEAAHQSHCQVEIFTKGIEADHEEYSIFDNKPSARAIEQEVATHDISHIDICGIAGDYCVLETLQGAIARYGREKLSVLTDFVASIDGGKRLGEAWSE